MASSQETAILAGGCFWGMQDLLRRYPGVISTRVGYSGGDVPNATYRNHGSHAEAIEIVFDPQKLSYRKLLEFFFQIHDPTTLNRQGNDRGTSYRSAIFYTTDEEKRTAEDTIADVDASSIWPGKVVTEVKPAGPFWQAEPEHQDYLERDPNLGGPFKPCFGLSGVVSFSPTVASVFLPRRPFPKPEKLFFVVPSMHHVKLSPLCCAQRTQNRMV